jgi:glutamate-1-semialdehyde 2,1-aminomutase
MSGTPGNAEWFERAQRRIPGGVNSPVRAFGSVGGTPPFLVAGRGATVIDAEGREYLDYVGSWGPLILGHRDEGVREAMEAALERGWTFGAPTPAEVTLAELVCEMVPSVDVVRMVNSGTEATLSALRLARGFTGRDKVIKFSGCYHGHHDALLVAAGSGLATLGTPSSPGVTEGTTRDTIVCPFNDLAAVEEAAAEHGEDLACIIVEPVAGNMGVVLPASGFLEGLRSVCDRTGALLVFDEVMTGFRVAPGGVQQRFGVMPDLTTLGKIIGGGMPVGAYGGRADVMEKVSPAGEVYQAGTLSGNPLAMAAGVATLERLRDGDVYGRLEQLAAGLEHGIAPILERHGDRVHFTRIGSMFTLFFCDEPVTDFESAMRCDTESFRGYHGAMLERGVYLPPSQFEANFISLAHSDADVAGTIEAIAAAVGTVLGDRS